MEAAAAGLPLLLRDLDQYRQTFGEGYEKGTDETFAASVKHFQSDRDYYREWQRSAEAVAERYDAKAGAERLREVYSEVIQNRAKVRR